MNGTDKRRICILDAGPLIHLDQLGRLDLIHQLGTIFIPESVAHEAIRHRPAIGPKIEPYLVPDVGDLSERLVSAMQGIKLHIGETAALAWAEKFGADLFVSDDRLARAVATVLGYRSTGTLGVIRGSFLEGLTSKEDALVLLRAIPFRTSLHVRAGVLNAVIDGLR